MTEVDRGVVRRKLTRIAEALVRLAPFANLSVDEYRGDWMRQKAIERLLQETIEAAIDVNHHLLSAVGASGPLEHRESFLAAGGQGILQPDLAEQLAPSAGLRNRLVHEYDAIDDALVLSALRSALDLFPRYVAAVEQFLDRN